MKSIHGVSGVIMFVRFLMFCFLVVSATTSAFAIDKSIQETLRSELKGKTVFLKSFNKNFNTAPLKSIPAAGSDLINAAFEIKKISFSSDSMKLESKLAVFVYNRDAGTIIKYDKKKPESVKIEIFLDSGGKDIASIRSTLGKVLTANLNEAKSLLPWSCPEVFMLTYNGDAWKCSENPPPDFLKFKNYTKPRVIQGNSPQYTDLARLEMISGTVSLLAEIDENGIPTVLAVFNPLGGGLTDEAIRAVRQWKFAPALDSDGKPIALPALLEVSFDLGKR